MYSFSGSFWTLKYGCLIKIHTSHKSARKSVFTLISTKVFVCICLNSRARTKIMIWNRRA